MEGSSSIEDQAFLDLQLLVVIRKKKESNKKVEEIKELLSEGANVNAKHEQFGGNTPLHLAVEVDDLEVLKYLLTVDSVDPNIENDRHETPLALAQRLHKSEIIKELTDHSVAHKEPIKAFDEDKRLQHYDGIPISNTDLIIKLAKPSHLQTPPQLPNDYVISRLVLAASRSVHDRAQLLPQGWTLLTAERSGVKDNDYVGVAYWNRDQQQIVVAHWCSCNATNVSKDERGGFTVTDVIDMVPMINATITFSHKILNLMNDLNKSGLHFQLSLTGHSVGGWLAQIAAFSVKYLVKKEGDVYGVNENNTGYQAHTVVFDSPGCREALLETISRLNRPLTRPLIALDITTYVSAPNRVNTCNTHLGIVYRIFVDLTYAEQKSVKDNLATHSMERIAKCFDPDSGHVKLDDSGQLKLQRVVEWPKLNANEVITQSNTFYKLVTKLNHYHPRPITRTFKSRGRYRTCEFNQTEYQMRSECQAHLHHSEKGSDIFKEYYVVLHRDYIKTRLENPFHFENDLGYLDEFLKSEKRILHVFRTVPIAGALIIYKHLQRLMEENSYKTKDYLFFPLRQVLSLESDVSFLKYLSETGPALLVLECQLDSEVKLHLSVDYISLLDALPNSKIILIGDEQSKLDHKDVEKMGHLYLYWSRALTKTSQKEIIENAVIDFQGERVTLSNVLESVHWSEFLDFELFIELSSKLQIKVGNKLSSYQGITDIQRTLTPLKLEFVIEVDCFKNSKVDIFVISNISVEELQPLISPEETMSLYQDLDETQLGCRFIILQNNDANSQFERLSAIHGPSKSVHWLHKVKFVKDFDDFNKCDEIIWRNSTGSFNEIKFEDEDAVSQAGECQRAVGWGASVTAKDITDQLVIVSGIDGMGKSTFLAQLALQIKDSDPTIWVVPIDLPTAVPVITLEVESGSSINDREYVMELLIDVLNLTTDVEIQLFRHYLRYENDSPRVVVLLDGFDEITAKQKPAVIDLVTTLKSMKIKQIWLSCRANCIRQLVFQKLSYTAYTLDELTEEQQIQLLHGCGQSYTKLKESNDFIMSLNKNMFPKPILLMMLAELNLETISQRINFPNITDIFELYTTKTLQYGYGSNYHSMVKMYQSMALLVLFPDNFVWLLSEWTRKRTLELLSSIERGHQQSAPLLSGIVNGIPHFIHRTFAEYLAAQWFMDTLAGDGDNVAHEYPKESVEANKLPEEICRLNVKIESLRLKRIFELFIEDVLNGEYSLLSHVCKLNLNENFITRLKVFVDDERLQQLKANNENCELLHFAAKRGHLNLVRRLIKGGADFTLRHYFQHTPLYYAVRNQDETLVGTLIRTVRQHFRFKTFEHIPEVSEDHLLHLAAYLNNCSIAQILLNHFKATMINSLNEIHDTPLHISSNLGFQHMVDLLITEGAEINLVNVYNHTPLYLACEQSHLNIVRSLVGAGADINTTHSPLHCAVNKGHLEVVRYLVSINADVNLRVESLNNNTPLHLAVEKGDVDVVMCLLCSDSIDVNVVNAKNVTPLMLAQNCNSQQIKGLFEVHLSEKFNIKDNDELQLACDNLTQKLKLALPDEKRHRERKRLLERFLMKHRDQNVRYGRTLTSTRDRLKIELRQSKMRRMMTGTKTEHLSTNPQSNPLKISLEDAWMPKGMKCKDVKRNEMPDSQTGQGTAHVSTDPQSNPLESSDMDLDVTQTN